MPGGQFIWHGTILEDKGHTVVRHGVEGGARAPAVALARGNELGPLATEAGVSLWDEASRLVVWSEEVEEEEEEVYGEEDAIDEEAAERRSEPSRYAFERDDRHCERWKGVGRGGAGR